MWAGMDAVETEGAIHVADLAGLKQREFAPADHHQIRSCIAPAADTVFGHASRADVLIPHLHFEWRKSGSDEVELADRANKFAKRRVLEQPVHHQHAQEVADNKPR